MTILPPPPPMIPPSTGAMAAANVVYVEVANVEIQRRRRQYEALRQLIGTGGSFRFPNNALFESTNNVFALTRQPSEPCRVQLLPDMMEDIKSYLVPQVKDIAKVLGASRPTVYTWLQGSSIPSETNFKRIEALHTAALKAKSMFADRDEKLVSTALISSDLVQLLHDGAPDKAIDVQLEFVAAKISAAEILKRAEANDAIEMFATARNMGKPIRPDASARAYIDAMTGKGYGPEVDVE